MIKIQISESELRTHASDLREASGGDPYHPWGSGNMRDSYANSINDFRTAIMESIEMMHQFSELADKDAARLEKMGEAFSKQDQAAGQAIEGMGLR
ncbi:MULTISPECIES: DUF3130 family protein [Listeria]|uniref:DUF3130 family protein n=1 Tax=Listeria TaxID=1637 RepID=UPI0013565F2B|nr:MULTISPECIES: DUF3130 family protein [Listeria]